MNKQPILRARAPGRIDFGGGGSDAAPYCEEYHGVVVNGAINYYAHATLVPRDDDEIHITALDLDQSETVGSVDLLSFEGELALLKACIKRAGPTRGLDLTVYSEIPFSSGLSSSAAVAVVVCGICTQYAQGDFDPPAMAQMAFAAERDDLNHWCGRQDQFAAALGGLNFLEFIGDDVPSEPADLGEHTLRQLEKNLLLVFTGNQHLAGNIHLDILDDYRNRRGTVLDGMHGLKKVGQQMRTALRSGDLASFAGLMNENWKYHQMLHPSCSTPQLQQFVDHGLANGALGAKVCGAGGGGCIVFYARDNEKPSLAKSLSAIGGTVIPFSFDFTGLTVW